MGASSARTPGPEIEPAIICIHVATSARPGLSCIPEVSRAGLLAIAVRIQAAGPALPCRLYVS